VAVADAARGRLIAVEGAFGPDLAIAARRVAWEMRDSVRGVSSWDSSGIFTELAVADPELPGPSARTLTLLYAADLAFRLRWQIRPLLEAGHSVIAAPYVQSAVAVGLAAGLPARWLSELFRFAPAPAVCYHVRHRPGRGRPARAGYVEFASTAIAASSEPANPMQLQTLTKEQLDRLERRGPCVRLTRDGRVRREPVSPSGRRRAAR